MSTRDPALWRPFVTVSLGIATLAGFGLGGALFFAAAADVELGLWWPAAAQAHGHAQLFGWAGLMVLGVGFHFLPRLLGAPLYRPAVARWVLGLLAGGIVLRALAQPAVALDERAWLQDAVRVGYAASGVAEVAGASLAVWLLATTMRAARAARKNSEVWAVVPFFAIAFTGLWGALAANALTIIRAAGRNEALLASSADRVSLLLAFYLFLIPVAVAMAARTFPLYFRTPPPAKKLLNSGLALLVAGTAARLIGDQMERGRVLAGGEIAVAGAFGCFVVGLGIFARRLPLPRRPVRPLTDPIQLHAISAFGWLLFVAILLTMRGSDRFDGPGWRTPLDAEWHALGAGFVTPLILGVGAHLLPGFARRPLRSAGLIWMTLLLANGAALLRIGPVLAGDRLDVTIARSLTGVAGLLGIAALIAFAFNLWGARRSAPAAIERVHP